MGELVAVFAAGVASAASPCLQPLYPGFLAYLSANAGSLAGRRASGLLGLLVLAGLLTTMVLIGALLLAVAIPVGRVASFLVPVIDGLLWSSACCCWQAATRSTGSPGWRSRSSATRTARPTCTA